MSAFKIIQADREMHAYVMDYLGNPNGKYARAGEFDGSVLLSALVDYRSEACKELVSGLKLIANEQREIYPTAEQWGMALRNHAAVLLAKHRRSENG